MSPTLPICRHRGAEFAPGRWVCFSTRLVAAKGVTRDVCSEICPCVNHAPATEDSAPNEPDAPAAYGVAIGTFDSRHQGNDRFGTEAVRLNLAVLRANCGSDVKILVCDDASPAESQRRYRAVCREYDAEFTSNSSRMGHTSGDMIVFHKAICWARECGLQTVTKLSHRMIFDTPNWVQVDSQRLLSSPYATQTQMLTNFGREQIRTECVMMCASAWSESGVLEHYRPRRIPYWNESHTFDAVARLVDPHRPYPHFLPWERLSFIRGGDVPPVYFREMRDAPNHFQQLAARHGIRLGSGFSTIDSCQTSDYL